MGLFYLLQRNSMKITINIDFDSENSKDMTVLNSLNDSIRLSYESKGVQPSGFSYEDAWQQCSWEIIALAVTVLKICDGISADKGTYAFFESLLNPASTKLCGPLTERAISSRVGRTAVICKKIGDFRLLEIAVRSKDKAKRVYVAHEAKDALLKVLSGDWGKEFNNYQIENGLEEITDFHDL
jgi:hypothetical protein